MHQDFDDDLTPEQRGALRRVRRSAPMAANQITLRYEPLDNVLRLNLNPYARAVAARYPSRRVCIEFDAHDNCVAIEIRAASWQVSREALESFIPAEQYLTLREAAVVARLAPVTLRTRIHLGHLAATKRGRDWLVHRKDLEEFLAHTGPWEWDL